MRRSRSGTSEFLEKLEHGSGDGGNLIGQVRSGSLLVQPMQEFDTACSSASASTRLSSLQTK